MVLSMQQHVLCGLLMLLLLLNQCQQYSAFKSWRTSRILSTSISLPNRQVASNVFGRQRQVHMLPSGAELLPVDPVDAEHLAFLLANVSDAIENSPETALSLASNNMAFLFSRDIPKLTNHLLGQYPVFREDQGMMRSYVFLLDFMETVSKEMSGILKENQGILKGLLEITKLSDETKVNEYIAANVDKLTKPGFLLYLDTEIQNQESNSPMENLLTTVKLRLLDECGKKMGVDVMVLPQLASETDPVKLKEKTIAHVETYDHAGKELFLQTLRIMQLELKKRYQEADPTLALNLQEVEKIVVHYLRDRATTL